jgi:ferritin-like metal-binding protein YciE
LSVPITPLPFAAPTPLDGLLRADALEPLAPRAPLFARLPFDRAAAPPRAPLFARLPFDRAAVPPARAVLLLRLCAGADARAVLPDARDPDDRDVAAAFGFDRDPFDRSVLPRAPARVDLLVAIFSSLSLFWTPVPLQTYPPDAGTNRYRRSCGRGGGIGAPWVDGRWKQTHRGGTTVMSDTPARDAKLVQLLNEAYTKEKQLESALPVHVQMTTRDDYAKRLKDHLSETKSHARQVSTRIKQLGGSPDTVSLPGPEGLTKAAESVSEVVGRAKAAAQGPLHAVRGSGEQEKMLRNARTEYQEEASEIATYTVIEALATAVGDKETAKLARGILKEEERMRQFLDDLLPELSVDVAHDEIPVSEIEGDAAHRTAKESKRTGASSPKRSGTSTRKKAKA